MPRQAGYIPRPPVQEVLRHVTDPHQTPSHVTAEATAETQAEASEVAADAAAAQGPAGDAEKTSPEPHTARPERLMVIVAHPDDADFGPAGTVAKWVRAGTVAHLVCCTSGDAGGEDPAIDPLQLAKLREKEQRAAA